MVKVFKNPGNRHHNFIGIHNNGKSLENDKKKKLLVNNNKKKRKKMILKYHFLEKSIYVSKLRITAYAAHFSKSLSLLKVIDAIFSIG